MYTLRINDRDGELFSSRLSGHGNMLNSASIHLREDEVVEKVEGLSLVKKEHGARIDHPGKPGEVIEIEVSGMRWLESWSAPKEYKKMVFWRHRKEPDPLERHINLCPRHATSNQAYGIYRTWLHVLYIILLAKKSCGLEIVITEEDVKLALRIHSLDVETLATFYKGMRP